MAHAAASIAAVFTFLLAGCTSGDAVANAPGGFEALAGDGLGAIRGVVVDDALVPLAGANITLIGGSTTTSLEDGSFAFSHLTPGTHRLNATADGHASAELQVAVTADVVVDVTLGLRALPSAEAYHETIPQTGFMACGFGGYLGPGGNWTFAACGPLTILGLYSLDRFMLDWPRATPFANLAGFFGETKWVSSQGLTGDLRIHWWIANGPYATVAQNAATWQAKSSANVVGRSPLNARVSMERVQELAQGMCQLPDKCYLLSGHYPAHRSLNTPIDQTIVFQQRYEDFLTLFYGGYLPDKFTALADG